MKYVGPNFSSAGGDAGGMWVEGDEEAEGASADQRRAGRIPSRSARSALGLLAPLALQAFSASRPRLYSSAELKFGPTTVSPPPPRPLGLLAPSASSPSSPPWASSA